MLELRTSSGPRGPFGAPPTCLIVRYEGNPARTRVELGLALAAVHEWFPVRTLVADMLERAGLEAADALDSWSALVLAEQLDVPGTLAAFRSDETTIVSTTTTGELAELTVQ